MFESIICNNNGTRCGRTLWECQSTGFRGVFFVSQTDAAMHTLVMDGLSTKAGTTTEVKGLDMNANALSYSNTREG